MSHSLPARLPQLAVATPWSFHFGASRVEDLAQAAAERGIHALGMSDLNGLWGAIPFQRACDQAGIKPLLGVHLQVEGIQARLLALNAEGYAALCRLSTRFQLSGAESQGGGVGRSRCLLEWLCEEGRGFALWSRDEILLAELKARRGPEELYVELPPAPAGLREMEAARRLQLPLLAAPEVVFASPEDFARHRLLVAIGANTLLSRLHEHPLSRERLRSSEAWLRDATTLRQDYAHAPEALQQALSLAERVEFRIPIGVLQQPRFPVENGHSAQTQLLHLCQRGLRRRHLPADGRYGRQLRRELKLIAEQGLADYFLIVADLVRFAQEQGIQNCGRGSAANSLISYLLGFTHIDPLRHELYFERFMNRGRSDFPDVDLDFAWDERNRVLDYVYQRYGRDRVAMISTHNTFAARGAVRELAKALGVPAREIGPITRAFPWYSGKLDPESLRRNPRTAHLPQEAEPWRTIFEQAQKLDGFPRHLGIHAGGLVLAPTSLTDHLPLQYAAKETEGGRMVITQWDMYPVEDAGLLKIDLLGNRGLAVIRDSIAAVRRNTGLQLDFQKLDPQQDSDTNAILQRGDTMGCFYIESPSMRSLLYKLRCRTFEVLVAASSIIRPGISSSGMMQAYVERYHHAREHGQHQSDWYLLPVLQEHLAETFGVMAYQEDVLKVAEHVAGMSPEDADGLRRSMTKKRAHHRIESFRRKFFEGTKARGIAPEVAKELWRQIESFSGYSFCKAHSASFAEVSYRSAYLRAHHPAEFMASVLANHGGFYSTFAYIAEAWRMGLQVLLPCINQSHEQFYGAGDCIRVGLAQIHGLSAKARRRLLQLRAKDGPFLDWDDFLRRFQPASKDLDALIRAGACDTLADDMTRPERLRAAALYQRHRQNPLVGEGSLFASQFPALCPKRPPSAPEFSRRQLLEMEAKALQFLVSAHPLELFQDSIRQIDVVPARDLRLHIDQTVRLVGWQVTNKPIQTRKGQPMMFLSFEDTTALYETVMFPEAYRRLAPWVLTRGPYLLEGVPRDEYGAITVDVRHLKLLDGQILDFSSRRTRRA